MASPTVHNVNVGVLGHVDSGKTSLVAALSTELSTAALDKNPQSKARGITLDLGFSAFTVAKPDSLDMDVDRVQFTLVDCPGHASLIRTIIGGAQIIDLVILVIDVTKGIQTQTAECLVVAEVCTDTLIVVLNKVDQLPADCRQKLVVKAAKAINKTLNATKFKGCTMVPVAAKPGGGEGEAKAVSIGMPALTAQLTAAIPPRKRDASAPFLFSVDHCFTIRGQGTILTGTCLQGAVKVNDQVELPDMKITKKIKSMQTFKRPVTSVRAGDRAALCFAQLDASSLERGLLAAPGSVPSFSAAVAAVTKIRFYPGAARSGARFHITIGHVTAMAEMLFFGTPDLRLDTPANAALQSETAAEGEGGFDWSREYLHQTELHGVEGRPLDAVAVGAGSQMAQLEENGLRHFGPQWVHLKFDRAITVPANALVIGAKYDADAAAGSTCRLAFSGRLLQAVTPEDLPKLRVFKWKMKEGTLERVDADRRSGICQGLVKKETNLAPFRGLQVLTEQGQKGVIEGAFGKAGKLKIAFEEELPPGSEGKGLTLNFKKFVTSGKSTQLTQ